MEGPPASSCVISVRCDARRRRRMKKNAAMRARTRTPTTVPTAMPIVLPLELPPLELLAGAGDAESVVVADEVLLCEAINHDLVGRADTPAVASTVGSPRMYFSNLLSLQQSFRREQQYCPDPQYQTASSPCGHTALSSASHSSTNYSE